MMVVKVGANEQKVPHRYLENFHYWSWPYQEDPTSMKALLLAEKVH